MRLWERALIKVGLGKLVEVNIDDFNLENRHFRHELAKALNVTPASLRCPSPAFLHEHRFALRDVWERVQATAPYTSTATDREYRRTAHLRASAPEHFAYASDGGSNSGALMMATVMLTQANLMNATLVSSAAISSSCTPTGGCP